MTSAERYIYALRQSKIEWTGSLLEDGLAKAGHAVIFTTGYATETNLIPIRTREKATVLQKPYGSHYLAQRLREKLDKKN